METKTFLPILLFLSSVQNSFSQLAADARPNQYFCVPWLAEETFQGALNGSASGGVPSYTYSWETEITFGSDNLNITFTTSGFLNDTTIFNPLIIDMVIDTLGFRLIVTNVEGATSSDTTTPFFYPSSHPICFTWNIQLNWASPRRKSWICFSEPFGIG